MATQWKIPTTKVTATCYQNSKVEVLWDGPLDSLGNPSGRGLLVHDNIKYVGRWGTALTDFQGNPTDPFFDTCTFSSMPPLDEVHYPDGSVFTGILLTGPGCFLRRFTGKLVDAQGQSTSGMFAPDGTLSSPEVKFLHSDKMKFLETNH